MPTSSQTSRQAWFVLAAAFLGWMFDGVEMGIFPLVARSALHEMQTASGVVDDKFVGLWMGRITAFFLIGGAVGGMLFGWLGDRLGRVRAMSLSILTYSLFTGFGYFAQTPLQLGGLRFIAALGMGGEWSLGVALVMEVWPRKHQHLLAGAIGAAANLGFGLIATVGLFFQVTQQSWRWVMLVGIAPAALIFFIRLFVPESDRWRESVRTHGMAKPLREIFSARLWRTTLLATAFASVVLIGTWGSVQWLPLWADKLAGTAAPHAKAYAQLLSALGSSVGAVVGAVLAQSLGRRWSFFAMCASSLAVCQALFRGIDVYGPAFLLLTFLTGATTGAFYGWLPLFLPEVFPTRVRATGQGFSYNFGRVLAAGGSLGMGALMQQFGGSYAQAGAVVTFVYGIGALLIWLAPETKGRPLPD